MRSKLINALANTAYVGVGIVSLTTRTSKLALMKCRDEGEQFYSDVVIAYREKKASKEKASSNTADDFEELMRISKETEFVHGQ